MKPFYQDNHNTIYCIDIRKNDLPNESVQCVATSPPYWGLRKYSGDQELIWGDNHCEHQWEELVMSEPNAEGGQSPKQDTVRGSHHSDYYKRQRISNTCSLCGAWKGAYGLEPTPEMYVQHTIEILREIRRTLRADGVVFWNIGDTYSATRWSDARGTGAWSGDRKKEANPVIERGGCNLPAKNLCLIPFRVAIAAQDDGWWVRSVIIWSKNNPMPESVTDRPTESHEYILMLTKSGTTQYWTHRDHEGTRKQPEPDYRWIKRISNIRGLKTKGLQELGGQEQHHGQDIDPQSQAVIEERDTPPEGWTPKNKMGWDRVNLWRGHDYYWDADAVREPYQPDSLRPTKINRNNPKGMDRQGVDSWLERTTTGRNIRSVWEFPTKPYPEAHFAVFPEKLPELCIKAATPEVGCCAKCGAPWARIVEVTGRQVTEAMRVAGCDKDGSYQGTEQKDYALANAQAPSQSKSRILESMSQVKETVGWWPSCKCNAPRVPSLVLDPMMGAGTTLLVAKKLNRYAIGYELSEEYCQLTVKRCRQTMLEI